MSDKLIIRKRSIQNNWSTIKSESQSMTSSYHQLGTKSDNFTSDKKGYSDSCSKFNGEQTDLKGNPEGIGPRGYMGPRGHTGPIGSVATHSFNYSLSHNLIISGDTIENPLIFGTPNVGSRAYSKGIFMAPMAGKYHFIVNVQFKFNPKYSPHHKIVMSLFKNHQPKVSTFETIVTDPNLSIQFKTYTINYSMYLKERDTVKVKFENLHHHEVILLECNSYFEGFRVAS
jgi:hypothetical protein